MATEVFVDQKQRIYISKTALQIGNRWETLWWAVIVSYIIWVETTIGQNMLGKNVQR